MATKSKRGRPPLYCWDDWFALGEFRLRRGRDYACPQSTMAPQIRSAAAKRELNILLSDDDNGFRVTVVRLANGRPNKEKRCRK